MDLFALETHFPLRSLTLYYINPSVLFTLFFTVYCVRRVCIAVCWSLNISVFNFQHFTLHGIFVLDVAALQFVGRSISVFLTFNILLCTVYLCWTWLHCSCWSLNISTFSNNLTINQFYLFLYIQHSCIHTSSLPTLPTILVETWEPFH